MLSAVSARLATAARSGVAARALHRSPASQLLVRSLEDVRNDGDVTVAATGTWESRRYLKREHGFGFSFHHTVLYAGKSTFINYKNHVEAVIIIQGGGEVEVVQAQGQEGQGEVTTLGVGDMYALNGHEKHYLRARPDEDMHVICAFNPPVVGIEDHNEEGVYPAVDDDMNKYYAYGPDALPALFKPPVTLREGSENN